MGRALGYFADDGENDNPELNKCPDCGCFFQGDNCPICGKECPEEMRAGNRKPPKRSPRKHSSTGRITFLEWYHSWWFIAIMLIIFPIVGIILLYTSPRSKKAKLIATAVILLYIVLIRLGGWAVAAKYIEEYKVMHPGITASELREQCESVDAEELVRMPTAFIGRHIKLNVTVIGTETDDSFPSSVTYYRCAINGTEYFVYIRDCRSKNDAVKYYPQDKLTVYGIGAGEASCFIYSDGFADTVTLTAVNMYAADLRK